MSDELQPPEVQIPYPGLRPFERDEAVLFFGRDNCVDTMVKTLERERFLAVLGASGSGKSSLVRTGLFDALEGGRAEVPGPDWTIADIRHPGGRPYGALASALLETNPEPFTSADVETLRDDLERGPRRLVQWWKSQPRPPGENLLILVDQFEELFRYRTISQRDNVEAFVDLLLTSADSDEAPIYVVITMRSEYLGVCALISGLAEQINSCLSLTPRMTREECEKAIVGPSRIAGFEIEPRLVTALLNDMNGLAPWADESKEEASKLIDQSELIARRSDQLPLMQHVLNRLWSRTTRIDPAAIPTLDAYRDLDGLGGALSQHADELLTETSDAALAERVFRAITEGDNLAAAVRRPLTIKDLERETGADIEALRRVIDPFRKPGANFLQPRLSEPLTPDTIIDISHESLIRQWRRLASWLVNEAEDARNWRDLIGLVERKDATGLLSERRLAFYLRWWDKVKPTEEWAKRYGGQHPAVDAYLKESEAEERRLIRRRKRQRTLAAVSVGVIALGLPVAGTVYALQRAEAARIEDQRLKEAQEARVKVLNATTRARLAETEAVKRTSEAIKLKDYTEQKAKSALAAVQLARADQQKSRSEAARVTMEAQQLRTRAGQLTTLSSRLLRDSTRQTIETAFRTTTRPDEAKNLLDSAESAVRLASDSSSSDGVALFADTSARLSIAQAQWAFNQLKLEDARRYAQAAQLSAQMLPSGTTRNALLAKGLLLESDAVAEANPAEALRLVTAARGVLPPGAEGQDYEAAMVSLELTARSAREHLREQNLQAAKSIGQSCAQQWLAISWTGEEATRAAFPCLAVQFASEEDNDELIEIIYKLKVPDFSDAAAVAVRDIRLIWTIRDMLLARNKHLDKAIGIYTAGGLLPENSFGEPTLLAYYESEKTPQPLGNFYLHDLWVYFRSYDFVTYTHEEGKDPEAKNIARMYEIARYFPQFVRQNLQSDAVAGNRASRQVANSLGAVMRRNRLLIEGGKSEPLSASALKRLEAEAQLVRLAIDASRQSGGQGFAIEPLVSGLLGGIDGKALANEIRRYPFFLAASETDVKVTPKPAPRRRLSEINRSQVPVSETRLREPMLLLSYLEAICAIEPAECRSRDIDPGAMRTGIMHDENEYTRELSSAGAQAWKEASEQPAAEPVVTIAYQGVDPVQCARDLHTRRNLASPNGPALSFDYDKAIVGDSTSLAELAAEAAVSDAMASVDSSKPKAQPNFIGCTLERGFGSFARVYEGKIWLFVSAENRDIFDRNPRQYLPEVTSSISSTLRFGRFINNSLTFFGSYADMVVYDAK